MHPAAPGLAHCPALAPYTRRVTEARAHLIACEEVLAEVREFFALGCSHDGERCHCFDEAHRRALYAELAHDAAEAAYVIAQEECDAALERQAAETMPAPAVAS